MTIPKSIQCEFNRVPCPKCGAKAGEQCIANWHRPELGAYRVDYSHAARIRLAQRS